MRWLKIGALSFLALLFQTSLFGPLSVNGIKPDLLIILIISFSLDQGYEFGAVYGVVVGICMDLVGGGIVGSNALAKTIIGAGAGSLKKLVFQENIILKVVLILAASIVHDFIMYIIQYIMRSGAPPQSISPIIFPAALYNMTIAALFLPFFYWIKKR